MFFTFLKLYKWHQIAQCITLWTNLKPKLKVLNRERNLHMKINVKLKVLNRERNLHMKINVYFPEIFRSSHPEVFLGKGFLKIHSKFTGENPWRSVISIKLQSNFIEIALWHECSPVNLLHIFRTLFLRTPLDGCFWILIFYLEKCLPMQISKIAESNILLLGWINFNISHDQKLWPEDQ